MTDDQQFVLALATVVLSTAVQIVTYRKASSTHDLVNGLSKQRERRARSQGAAAQRASDAAAPKG